MTIQELYDTLQIYAHSGYAQAKVTIIKTGDDGEEKEQEITKIKPAGHKVILYLEPKK